MNYSRGFVYLPRSDEEDIINHLEPSLEKLFLYLLKKARYKREPSAFGIQRGELATGLSDIAESCSFQERGKVKIWSKAKVKRMLEKLEAYELIKYKPNGFGTHITICNYSEMQDGSSYEANASETQANASETGAKQERNRSETQANLYKKDNKGKKVKKDKKEKKEPSWSEEELSLFEHFNLFRKNRFGSVELKQIETSRKVLGTAIKKIGLEDCKLIVDWFGSWSTKKEYAFPKTLFAPTKLEEYQEKSQVWESEKGMKQKTFTTNKPLSKTEKSELDWKEFSKFQRGEISNEEYQRRKKDIYNGISIGSNIINITPNHIKAHARLDF